MLIYDQAALLAVLFFVLVDYLSSAVWAFLYVFMFLMFFFLFHSF